MHRVLHGRPSDAQVTRHPVTLQRRVDLCTQAVLRRAGPPRVSRVGVGSERDRLPLDRLAVRLLPLKQGAVANVWARVLHLSQRVVRVTACLVAHDRYQARVDHRGDLMYEDGGQGPRTARREGFRNGQDPILTVRLQTNERY